MKSFLKIFSCFIFLVTNVFANVHDDIILLKKLLHEKNFYKAKELAERLLVDPSSKFFASLVLSDIEFLEGNLFSSKNRIELLIEMYPDKVSLLKKTLRKN